MKKNLSTVIWSAGVALPVVLGIVASFWSFGEMQKAADERKRTFIVLDCAHGLLSNLRDAETGQRGYTLTGDEVFLAPYLKAKKEIPSELDRLQQLTLLKEAHQKADELIPLANRKMDEMAHVIEVRRSQGLAAAAVVVATARGKALMDSIRAVMGDLIQREEAALAQRDAKLQTATRWLFAALVCASLLTLLIAATFVYARTREAQKIRTSEVRYRRLLEKAPLPLCHVTKEGEIDFRNERFLNVFGYTADDVPTLAEWWLRAYPDPQYRRWATATWDAAVRQAGAEGRDIQEIEYKVVCKNGEERVIEASGIILGDEFLVTFFDITARKREEENLRRMATVVRDSNDAITIQDFEGRITAWNSGAELMYGYSEEEALLANIERLTTPGKVAEQKDFIRRLIAGEAITSFETQRVTRDGRVLDVWMTVTKLMDDAGKPIGLASTERDITARKRAEEQVQSTLLDLDRSNKELEQFAYIASHDLQEPLRMVASYTQLLAQRYEGQLDEKARKYINYAVDGATRMQRLINDLLTYARVGSRAKPPEPTDLHAVLDEAIANLQAVIAENHAVITHDDLPTLKADASQLVQVFQNLIANAIKFKGCDIPRIHISVRDDAREWVIRVQDNGIGIDPQYKARLFVIFQRLHTREEYPGTGIGLAVCKRIVERHGGRIWFESELGKGTTFLFTVAK